MTIWNGKLMRENELSGPAKIVLGIGVIAVIGSSARTAVQNASGGIVTRPWALGLAAVGIAALAVPRLAPARRLAAVSILLGVLLAFA
jgi:hypothetical protein